MASTHTLWQHHSQGTLDPNPVTPHLNQGMAHHHLAMALHPSLVMVLHHQVMALRHPCLGSTLPREQPTLHHPRQDSLWLLLGMPLVDTLLQRVHQHLQFLTLVLCPMTSVLVHTSPQPTLG